jgi:hypothetical protein
VDPQAEDGAVRTQGEDRRARARGLPANISLLGNGSHERYKKGKENKTEYRDLNGHHATYVADILVTASRGIPNDEIEGIEPFDLRALHRYEPALVSGWISEEPSRTHQECQALARLESTARIGQLLQRFMPGDGTSSGSSSWNCSDGPGDVWTL